MTTILIHGGTGTGSLWDPVRGLIHGTVMAPDLPGRRNTPLDHRNASLEVFASHVIDLMDRSGIEQANLVGHSLGGGTIIAMAALIPERINNLIFLAAPVPEDGGTIHSALGADAQNFITSARSAGSATLEIPFDASSIPEPQRPVPEAVAPFYDSVPVRAVAGAIAVHYIRTLRDVALPLPSQDDAIANLRIFAPVSVKHCDTGHEAMLTDPACLAILVNEIIGANQAG